jgi:hypothetical protein
MNRHGLMVSDRILDAVTGWLHFLHPDLSNTALRKPGGLWIKVGCPAIPGAPPAQMPPRGCPVRADVARGYGLCSSHESRHGVTPSHRLIITERRVPQRRRRRW